MHSAHSCHLENSTLWQLLLKAHSQGKSLGISEFHRILFTLTSPRQSGLTILSDLDMTVGLIYVVTQHYSLSGVNDIGGLSSSISSLVALVHCIVPYAVSSQFSRSDKQSSAPARSREIVCAMLCSLWLIQNLPDVAAILQALWRLISHSKHSAGISLTVGSFVSLSKSFPVSTSECTVC